MAVLETLEMSYGDINDALNTIAEADSGLKDIMQKVTKVMTDLINDALGLMVNVLQAAVDFLKNAFQHFIQNLIDLGNTVRRVVQEHQTADRDGANALKSVLK